METWPRKWSGSRIGSPSTVPQRSACSPLLSLSVSQLLQTEAGHQRLLWGFLRHFLLSSWPLLLVMLGTGLSRDAFADEPRHSWRKKGYECVDLKAGYSTSQQR